MLIPDMKVIACLGALVLAGCAAPAAKVGTDADTRSNASVVTWTDGQPAYSITCDLPGGCMQRAEATCNHRAYTTLQSENMPSIGTRRAALGPPSIVIRCG